MELARCSICGGMHPVEPMITAHKKAEDVPGGARGRFARSPLWSLANADEMHARHPRSYFIPDLDRRMALLVGECVRLEFHYGRDADREQNGHAERMWVEVLEQRADGRAHGRLRNRPARLVGLDIGDVVPFEPENVVAIEYTDEELGYAQADWAVIDRAAIEQDRAPDIVARAAPGPYSADRDAWWMILREQPAGPTIEGVNGLTDRFPGLAEPLRAGAGLWERTDGVRERARWRLVPDTEIATSEEWQRFFRWLAMTAERMRTPPAH
jgi:hypothetical protein